MNEDTPDWREGEIALQSRGLLSNIRGILAGATLGIVAYTGLALLLLLRLIERPLFGMARPWTPYITQQVCRAGVWLLGLQLSYRGTPMKQRGAMVSNHVSWMDIFVLNACARIYFVAKAEVSAWAGIGWLARATGTVFVARKGTESKRQQNIFEDRLRFGHQLLFFPEGTSTDGQRVLPFKSTLFAAFYSHGLEEVMRIQPVSLIYHAPKGEDPRYYGWWANMTFGRHLWQVLTGPRGGRVEVVFHEAVAVDAFRDRKALSVHCEAEIRAIHAQGIQDQRV